MKRLVMLLVLLLPSPSRGSDYVLAADGYYWLNGAAYTRTYVQGYWYYSGGCKYWYPGSYSYSKVVVNKPATNPNDWRQEIAKAARERLEHQNFLESLRFAGLDAPKQAIYNGGSAYGSLSVGNYGVSGNTIYGYQGLSQLSDIYNSGDLQALFLQASRLTENAQSLAGQAHLSFTDRLGQESASRAKVAEIVALGQLLNSMRSQQKTESKLEFKFSKDGKIEALPEPRVEDGDVFKKWNTSAQICSGCHFGAARDKLAGGFDISVWPNLPLPKKIELAQKHLLTDDAQHIMPRTKDGKPGQKIPEKDILDLWLRVGAKQ